MFSVQDAITCTRALRGHGSYCFVIQTPGFGTILRHFNVIFTGKISQGGDLEDFYPDVCVEGLEKDPF